ncbi:hypothetical protein EH31_09575 [Erythrobacter longus]|uniref:Methyltransferase FkbM domain-containing protein n=1 Tax=Erythrobacter longus TaxID=1044 RepID=A0A074MA78_ERYLO|nr:hypothetical protein EH31_09575 [Erythrobacter longus]
MRFGTHYGFPIGGNTRDMVSRYIFTFGYWEPNLSEFLASRITPQTKFYDLGTNIGYFSLLAASRGADVVGFEASPQMAATAKANLEKAGLRGMIHNVALAAEVGELTLYDRSGPTNTGSRTINKPENAVIHAKVPAAPLRNLVELDPKADNVFKIDIEGAEGPVLDELADWLLTHPEATATIVVELLEEEESILERFKAARCEVAFLRNDYSRDAYLEKPNGFELTKADEPRPAHPYETVFIRG